MGREILGLHVGFGGCTNQMPGGIALKKLQCENPFPAINFPKIVNSV